MRSVLLDGKFFCFHELRHARKMTRERRIIIFIFSIVSFHCISFCLMDDYTRFGRLLKARLFHRDSLYICFLISLH